MGAQPPELSGVIEKWVGGEGGEGGEEPKPAAEDGGGEVGAGRGGGGFGVVSSARTGAVAVGGRVGGAVAAGLGLRWAELPPLRDIDRPEDLALWAAPGNA